MAANRLSPHIGRLLLVAFLAVTGLLASEHHGIVKSGGLPVPGATITATQGDKKVVTTTDETGAYSFPDLEDGTWTLTIESLGFVKESKEIGVVPDAPPPMWDLKYQTLEALTAPKTEPTPTPAAAPTPTTATVAGATPEKPADTKPAAAPPATPATASAAPAAKGKANNKKNDKNAKPAAGATNDGRPSLNAALAGRGQGGGFTRLGGTNLSGDNGADNTPVEAPPQDMGDAGNQAFAINGSVSSGLDMPPGGGDWMAGGGRGGPGGMGGMGGPDFGGGMGGPGGMPGMGGDPNAMGAGGAAGAGMGGPGGGGGGRGGGGGGMGGPGGGGGGRGGGGMAGGMMGGMPNIGGGRGGRGGAGGPGGRGGRNPGAFGNNRRDPRGRYNFTASINGFTNSALDARQYSVTGQSVNKPSSQNLRSTLTAGGPLKIPHIFDTKGKGTFTVNYSLTRNRQGDNWTDLVPTAAEREGNFAGVMTNAHGAEVPVTLYGPGTANGNQVTNISPVAAALLKFFPLPNFSGGTATSPLNFAASGTGYTNGDNINARLSYTINTKNQVSANIQWQRQDTSTPSVFSVVTPAWRDTRTNNGWVTSAQYVYHFSPRIIATSRVNYSKSNALVTPYFAFLNNLEGTLGILGTDQAPIDWGPPSLSFNSGLLGLSATNPSFSHPQTAGAGETVLWVHTTHQFQFGGDISRRQQNTLSQNNPRGNYSFTGFATSQNGLSGSGSGFDFADFLLATPYTMGLNVANSLSGAEAAQLMTYANGSVPANLAALQNTPSGGDRYLRTTVYDLYAQDNWTITPRISVLLGLRWDYQAPTTELYNRLATIDLPGNFQIPTAAYNKAVQSATGLSVVAGQVGPVTGYQYSDSMLNGKKTDFSPRFGFAWKPWAKHTMVIRGGWGLYFNPSVYAGLVGLLDAQSPFGTAYNLTNTCGATLQNGLNLTSLQQLGCAPQYKSTTTNAMNPNFRVGYTQTWQMAVQTNLIWNTVATVTYGGSKGTGLASTFYPNSYAYGGSLNCPAGEYCPNNFSYQSSNANSTDELVQFQLQRRLRSGFGASASFQFNKAIDDTGTAQNWLDQSAEKARTAGVRNETGNFNIQYSTGVGARGGALVNGWKGVLFKDWTVMPGINVASGAPINITDQLLTIGGTSSAAERVNYTGGPVFVNGILNKAAFGEPAAGQFGTLGRNVFNGPGQFSTSLSANRTFRLADRKNLTFSVQMQNPINHPVVSNWYSAYNSLQFGLPSGYAGMRTVSFNMRLSF